MSTFNQTEVYQAPRTLLWLSICALAMLYGMFSLGWMIYRVHLPAQMTQLGFSEQAAPLLLLVEAILTIAVEPLAGAMSDRINRQQHTRWPLIFWGVVLSSLLFVIFSTQVAFIASSPVTRWTIVLLLLAWAVAMSLFRSPALALLRGYAPSEKLPQAASLLTLAFGLSAAATPLASPLVLKLGLTLSFTLGAILILVGAVWLQSTLPVASVASIAASTVVSRQSTAPLQPVRFSSLAKIFGLGFATMLAFRLAVETFPKLLKAQIPNGNPPLFVGLLLITLGLAALPIGKLALRQGNSRMIQIGAAIALLFLLFIPLSRTAGVAVVVAIGLGIGFSAIWNGALPFALMQVSVDRAGLGIGMLFAGVAAATSLMLGLFKPGVLSPTAAIGLGIVALIGVAGVAGLHREAESRLGQD
jgi:Major Facilitator Superfamily